jgi:PPM family protein phosphatase
MLQVELSWGAATDRGLREENQDHYLAAPPVFAVADGMGGHADGAAASATAVARLEELADGRAIDVDTVRTALKQADQDIQALGGSGDRTSRPGTTVAGVALTEQDGAPVWLVFHVGDSRIYRWSADRGLEQVSSDHSVVQALVDAGAITEKRALTHPQRHMITRALGFGEQAEPDFSVLPVTPGERLLLCSDGLTGELSDARIEGLMASDTDERESAERLVAVATAPGAQDNVTVVIVGVGPSRRGQHDVDARSASIEGTDMSPEGERH